MIPAYLRAKSISCGGLAGILVKAAGLLSGSLGTEVQSPSSMKDGSPSPGLVSLAHTLCLLGQSVGKLCGLTTLWSDHLWYASSDQIYSGLAVPGLQLFPRTGTG